MVFQSVKFDENPILETAYHAMSADNPSDHHGQAEGETRRDFLFLTAAAFGAVGAGSVAWPFINQMNPAADTVALSTTEVNLAPIEVGQAITVMWQGKPVFIRHRTPEEISEAEGVDIAALRDPQTDDQRIQQGHKQWLILVGICTHLGCVPQGQKSTDVKGEYGGWFCPCHGSHYDTSGRIRKGPAPKNLAIPKYEFLSDTNIRIG